MRIGLICSEFDPPHLGHLARAHAALKTHKIESVWFLPKWHRDGSQERTEYYHRAAMCYRLTRSHKLMMVCLDNLLIQSENTFQILAGLTYTNPGKDFRWILRSTRYDEITKNVGYDPVLTLSPPLWAAHPGDPEIPGETVNCDVSYSSTEILEKLKNGEKPRGLSAEVQLYITKHGLYRS